MRGHGKDLVCNPSVLGSGSHFIVCGRRDKLIQIYELHGVMCKLIFIGNVLKDGNH